MSLRRALTGLCSILLLLGFVRLSPAGAQQGKRAGLIVQLPDVPPLTYCVEWSKDSFTGFELLQSAGLEIIAEHSPMGAAVCSLNGTGCPASDCFCRKTIYWSYWHLVNGSWVYGAMGSSSYQVADGAVEGWVWGDGKSPPPTIPFSEICAAASATPTLTPSQTPTASNTPSATPSETATPTPTQQAAAASATPTTSSVPSSTPTSTLTPQANAAVQASATALPSSTPVQASASSAQQAATSTPGSVPSSTPVPLQPSPPVVTPAAAMSPTPAVSATLGTAGPALSATPTLGINQPRRTPVTSTPRPTITPSSTPAPLPSLAAPPPPKGSSRRPPLLGYAIFGLLLVGLGAAALLLRLRR